MAKEMHEFQAETKQLLDLMVHSIYTNHEIFLRELISNASDAIDKLHYESLTNADLLEGAGEFNIYLEPDADNQTLTISDNGIGMNRQEVIDNIGTIAKSGTKAFLNRLKEAKAANEAISDKELIGQFGVGKGRNHHAQGWRKPGGLLGIYGRRLLQHRRLPEGNTRHGYHPAFG